MYPKASSAHSPGKSTNRSFPVLLLPMQALGIREGKHNKIWQTRGCATLYMVVTSIYPASFFAPRLFAPYKLAAAMIKAINAYRDGVKASPTSLFLVRAISSCRKGELRLRPARQAAYCRETMVVRDYLLLTLFLKFHNLASLLCHFAAAQAE